MLFAFTFVSVHICLVFCASLLPSLLFPRCSLPRFPLPCSFRIIACIFHVNVHPTHFASCLAIAFTFDLSYFLASFSCALIFSVVLFVYFLLTFVLIFSILSFSSAFSCCLILQPIFCFGLVISCLGCIIPYL